MPARIPIGFLPPRQLPKRASRLHRFGIIVPPTSGSQACQCICGDARPISPIPAPTRDTSTRDRPKQTWKPGLTPPDIARRRVSYGPNNSHHPALKLNGTGFCAVSTPRRVTDRDQRCGRHRGKRCLRWVTCDAIEKDSQHHAAMERTARQALFLIAPICHLRPHGQRVEDILPWPSAGEQHRAVAPPRV